MNKFSFADYIFRQAYPQHSGDRGIAEVKAMNEATRDSENSNNAISEFNNKFSLRAMRDLTVGTDSAGGFNVADKVTAPAFQNFYSESFFMKYRNSSFGTEIQCHYQFKIKSCDIDGIWSRGDNHRSEHI